MALVLVLQNRLASVVERISSKTEAPVAFTQRLLAIYGRANDRSY